MMSRGSDKKTIRSMISFGKSKSERGFAFRFELKMDEKPNLRVFFMVVSNHSKQHVLFSEMTTPSYHQSPLQDEAR